MVDAISNPFMTASAATGRVKVYQSVVGGILLTIVPLAYIPLKLGAEPYVVFVVHLSIAVIAFVTRLYIVSKLINLSVIDYIKKVIIPSSCVGILSVLISVFIKQIFPKGLLFSICEGVLILLVVGLTSFFLGLTKGERYFVLSKVPIIKNKI